MMAIKNVEYKEKFFILGETRCSYCDKILNNDDQTNPSKVCVDHILPICKNGQQHINNLTFSCFRCNQKKGGRSLYEFKENVQRRIVLLRSELIYHENIFNKFNNG